MTKTDRVFISAKNVQTQVLVCLFLLMGSRLFFRCYCKTFYFLTGISIDSNLKITRKNKVLMTAALSICATNSIKFKERSPLTDTCCLDEPK